MEHDAAYRKISENIFRLVLELPSPQSRATRAAVRATQDLDAALRGAAGVPADALWHEAFESLTHLLELCAEPPTPAGRRALRELRDFVEENADVLVRQPVAFRQPGVPADAEAWDRVLTAL